MEEPTVVVPAPRVEVPPTRDTTILYQKRLQNTERQTTTKELPSERAKVRDLIREKMFERARIPQRHRMQLRNSERREQVQLIQDEATGSYLTYRKLLRDPKHRDVWEKSASNEFGRLCQGLSDGRVKGTNTLFFIKKDAVPKERRQDITYGNFVCEL